MLDPPIRWQHFSRLVALADLGISDAEAADAFWAYLMKYEPVLLRATAEVQRLRERTGETVHGLLPISEATKAEAIASTAHSEHVAILLSVLQSICARAPPEAAERVTALEDLLLAQLNSGFADEARRSGGLDLWFEVLNLQPSDDTPGRGGARQIFDVASAGSKGRRARAEALRAAWATWRLQSAESGTHLNTPAELQLLVLAERPVLERAMELLTTDQQWSLLKKVDLNGIEASEPIRCPDDLVKLVLSVTGLTAEQRAKVCASRANLARAAAALALAQREFSASARAGSYPLTDTREPLRGAVVDAANALLSEAGLPPLEKGQDGGLRLPTFAWRLTASTEKWGEALQDFPEILDHELNRFATWPAIMRERDWQRIVDWANIPVELMPVVTAVRSDYEACWRETVYPIVSSLDDGVSEVSKLDDSGEDGAPLRAALAQRWQRCEEALKSAQACRDRCFQTLELALGSQIDLNSLRLARIALAWPPPSDVLTLRFSEQPYNVALAALRVTAQNPADRATRELLARLAPNMESASEACARATEAQHKAEWARRWHGSIFRNAAFASLAQDVVRAATSASEACRSVQEEMCDLLCAGSEPARRDELAACLRRAMWPAIYWSDTLDKAHNACPRANEPWQAARAALQRIGDARAAALNACPPRSPEQGFFSSQREGGEWTALWESQRRLSFEVAHTAITRMKLAQRKSAAPQPPPPARESP